jgi:hypothetical protein
MADLTKYPTGLDYQQALYNTSVAFQDSELRGGAPVLNPLRMPKAISGNFASVFTIDGTDGRRWAVKCFTHNVRDQALRYDQVSKALRQVSSPWKVEFQYLTKGVLCQGTWYPALKMEWVEATGLLPYVETHLGDPDALADLAERFGHLVQDLASHGIAHGDLQHGNILVTPSRELKLIDYDGMFVPELASRGASELGHANYQSPLRTAAHWGPDIDRFSSWVIYTSLGALALDPTLWPALHADGDEALLFHQSDFRGNGSRVRNALARSPVAMLREAAQDIDFLWATDLAAIPPLAAILDPASPPASRRLPTANHRPRTGIDWLRQHQSVAGVLTDTASTPAVPEPAGPIGTAAWLTTHLAGGPSVEFPPPKVSIRVLCVVLLGVAVLCALHGLLFLAPVPVAVIWASTLATYRSSPEGREKRSLRKEFRADRSAVRETSRMVADLERVARHRTRWAERKKSVAERKVKKARAEEQREIDSVNNLLDREVKRISDKISALQSRESAEVADALATLQQAHIDDRLRTTIIGVSRIPTIGPVIAVYLAGAGIVTAADIAGVRGAAIVRRNGTEVSPHGVGEQRAAALYAWRLDVEAKARANQPTALPTTQRQQITNSYAQQKRSLESAQADARVAASAEVYGVRRKWEMTHDDLARQLQDAISKVAFRRADLDWKIAALRKQAETLAWHRDYAKKELDRYRRIRYSRYLRRLVTA